MNTIGKNRMQRESATRRLVRAALLVALSLSLFLLEGLIPLPFLAPGAKLGIANLVTLIAILTMPARTAALIVLTRIALASFFGGGPTVFLYSLAGGTMSLLGMLALKKTHAFSLFAVSAAGGFLHNAAQLAVGAAAASTPALFSYLPILGPCGILTGLLLAVCASRILARLPHALLPMGAGDRAKQKGIA